MTIFVIQSLNERYSFMLKYLLFFIISLVQLCVNAQVEATTINCIQSDASGTVTFSWQQDPNTSGTFVEYQIYSIQNGLLTTISSIGTISYTTSIVSQAFDFYVVVVGDTQESSDTISNIFLTLNNPSDGTAVLQWNDPVSPALPSMNEYYKIYREYPAGIWNFLDSVPYGTTSYKDTIDICQAFLSYQILLMNQPCNYTSNIVGDNFEDIITPDIPIISNITIDTLTDNLTINWNQNSQSDTYGYIVYSIDANGFPTEIDTVWGYTNTSYIYNPDVTGGPLSYSIAAFDSCFTSSVVPTYQTSAKAEVHTSIYLRNTLSVCDNVITLYWTPYTGWENVTNYEIWGHIVGQPWQNFGTTHSLQFNITSEPLQDYCFAIKGISPDGTESFSNRICFNVTAPSQPAFNYLQVATVTNNKIELHHLIDVIGGVKAIAFQRKNNQGLFEDIGQVDVTSSNIIFTDSEVSVDRKSYTYRAVVIDSCGNYGVMSNVASTILLTITTEDVEMRHHLDWTEYEAFDGPLLGYSIYRGYDGNFDPTPLAFVSNSQFFYEDTASQFPSTSGKTCYFVEAVEGVNIYGLNEVSRSNIVCPIIKPIIYIPNSFTPDGDNFNQIFIPSLTFFEISTYNLTIFDRWEHPIFESNNAETGWTGEIRNTGKKANPGTYLYLLKITDGEGKEIVKRGHVNLIR